MQGATISGTAAAAIQPEGAGRLHVAGHKGQNYRTVLRTLHTVLRPRSYVEIGVSNGATLRLADCASVGVDPDFRLDGDVMGSKPFLAMRRCGSDEFFAGFDPRALFGQPHVDFFFLDGMHLFEFLLRDIMNAERFCRPNSIIALHDCLPVDMHMTRRVGEQSPYPSLFPGWWTGDVWRVLPVLRKYRADLRIHCLDAPPTGLVLITGLDPASRVLSDRYGEVVADGLSLDLAEIGLQRFFDGLPVRSTQDYGTLSNLSRHFWL